MPTTSMPIIQCVRVCTACLKTPGRSARAGTMAEVAEAVIFLLSEASTYTTGAILRVAGGR